MTRRMEEEDSGSGARGEIESDWGRAAAAALRAIARDEAIKERVIADRRLHTLLSPAAGRFVAGETLDECLARVREIETHGHETTIDAMGESTRSAGGASLSRAGFVTLLASLDSENLRASLSLDLSHIGLAIDEDLCLGNAAHLAEMADRS